MQINHVAIKIHTVWEITFALLMIEIKIYFYLKDVWKCGSTVHTHNILSLSIMFLNDCELLFCCNHTSTVINNLQSSDLIKCQLNWYIILILLVRNQVSISGA